MKPVSWTSIAKNLLFAFVGFFFIYWVLNKQPVGAILEKLQEANWQWAFMILVISVLSYWVRAIRWRGMLVATEHHPSLPLSFASLMLGYLVNLGIPRLGEVTRCTVLQQKSGTPFRLSFGTVITERFIDFGCLILVIFLTLLFETENIISFCSKEVFPPVSALFKEKSSAVRLVGILAVLTATLLLAYSLAYWKKLLRYPLFRLASRFTYQVWKGVSSIGKMGYKKKWGFFFQTLLIWGSYYLMTYLWFFCFDATSSIGWKAGLTMLSIGSLAKSLPIQGGGMGAYHYLFIQGIALYGVSSIYGASLAVMVHGLQLLLNLFIGGLCAIYIILIPSASPHPQLNSNNA